MVLEYGSRIFKSRSAFDILSRVIFFKLCRSKLLVSLVSNTLKSSSSTSTVHALFKYLVYSQFCGGRDLESSLSLARNLKEMYCVRSIVDLSSEEADDESASDRALYEKAEVIKQLSESASDTIRFTPVKCTSVVNYRVLEKITSLINIDPSIIDSVVLNDLSSTERNLFDCGLKRLCYLCSTAKDRGLCILIDAEQSSMQPAVELVARFLQRKFNKHNAVVFNTYQMYLARIPQVIMKDMKEADTQGYIFSIKLVRGAYLQSERNRLDCANTLVPSKKEVDVAYDSIVELMLQRISASSCSSDNSRAAVVLATHNQASVELAVTTMNKLSLPRDDKRIHFAQILGMADHLTHGLGLAGYNAHKLVCFGAFEQLLPWLLRRVDENQDILGATQTDAVAALERELYRRLLWR